MDIPEKIAGVEWNILQNAFKEFLEISSEWKWVDGKLVAEAKRMSPQFLSESLSVSLAEASAIHEVLFKEDWIDPVKNTPTRKGMALAQHVDREKIPRAQALEILEQVINWAENVAVRPQERVAVKTIHLYGSLLRGADQVGDIDIFVEFTTTDLIDQGIVEPEDMELECELCEELAAISDYVSPSSWFDRRLMEDVPMKKVFPRGDASL
ncbi:hypothetical protein SAMN02744133_108196 [Thalassospira xiamenensis M-5 = DSM 17429]|uniref:Polymerase nucleotidyl transferase domain-containing protein n=1 Tax=Thalassospira xiamenensis M-5 = DSM 17429 TaxID=1123366 RepID=A0AB72UK44_9PROT|nr:hypothetical protein [Thalassospira xiamenensis]AJD54465.1 hypothetical protein TH3_21963 [Thalassospira xiamenensis M-5 = DSM 17429]SIT22388.1 hypothetical protein SAMN02744133_108196 [Thalassospira xiamenensis M-5 = DSM 17429]